MAENEFLKMNDQHKDDEPQPQFVNALNQPLPPQLLNPNQQKQQVKQPASEQGEAQLKQFQPAPQKQEKPQQQQQPQQVQVKQEQENKGQVKSEQESKPKGDQQQLQNPQAVSNKPVTATTKEGQSKYNDQTNQQKQSDQKNQQQTKAEEKPKNQDDTVKKESEKNTKEIPKKKEDQDTTIKKDQKEIPKQDQKGEQNKEIKETKEVKDVKEVKKDSKKEDNTKIQKEEKGIKDKVTDQKQDEKKDQKKDSKQKKVEQQVQVQKSEEELRAAYFEQLKSKLADGESQKVSLATCDDIVDTVEQDILANKCSVSEECKDADVLAAKIALKISEVFEINIKETQLKERKRIKQLLEDKLQFIDQDITIIQHEIDPLEIVKKTRGKELTEEERQAMEENQKAIARERKELEKKRAKRIEEAAEKERLLKEQAEAQEKEEKLKREAEKAAELKKKLEDQKKYQEQRDEQFRVEREKLKKILQSKPLFEKLRERSDEEAKVSLEQKKQTLAAIRQLHQPLSVQEIKDHAKKVKQQLEIISEKHQAVLAENAFNYQKPFVSEAYKRVAKEKKELIMNFQEESKKHHDFQEKMKNFEAKTLKKTIVKVDPMKQSQIKAAIEEQQHKPDFHWFREKKRPKLDLIGIGKKDHEDGEDNQKQQQENHSVDGNEKKQLLKGQLSERTHMLQENDQLSRKLGKDYLNMLRQARGGNSNHAGKTNGTNGVEGALSDVPKQRESIKNSRLKYNASEEAFSSQNTSLPGIRTNKSSHQQSNKIDYLSELRAQHGLRSSSTPDWQRFLQKNSKLTVAQKGQYILKESERLEQLALRKEILLRNGVKGNNDKESAEDIDSQVLDTYIESIKAKFAFIEQAQEEGN